MGKAGEPKFRVRKNMHNQAQTQSMKQVQELNDLKTDIIKKD